MILFWSWFVAQRDQSWLYGLPWIESLPLCLLHLTELVHLVLDILPLIYEARWAITP